MVTTYWMLLTRGEGINIILLPFVISRS